jgi:3'(2'), 5'-bisphosphate nucleotidase
MLDDKGPALQPLHPEGRPFDLDRAAPDAVAALLAEFAIAAGPAVMEVYAGAASVSAKADGSPVTLADERAEAIICHRLAQGLPGIPVVAEEMTAAGRRISIGRRFVLVDPLDGTKEFITRNGEFTINVALIEAGRPIAGAVYAPVLERLWFGGDHAFVCDLPVGAALPPPPAWRPIRARAAPESLVVLASRSHADEATEAFLARLPVADRRAAGSSLKFCLVAEGLADVYPRFGPTMEWDTAAGDAVLRAAGGVVLDSSGAPLAYGKIGADLRNGSFVAWGDPAAAARFQ